MKFLKNLLVFSLSILLFNCGSSFENKNNKIEYVNKISLKKVGEISFPLDTLSSNSYEASQYIEQVKNDSVRRYFTFYNPNTHSIYVYDYDSRHLDFKIPLQKQGPNGVGTMFNASGYHIKSWDSIFIYSDNENKFSIVNKSGIVLKSHRLPDLIEGDTIFSSPYITDNNRMIVSKDKVYFIGFFSGEPYFENAGNRPTTIILDINTGKVRHEFSYPAPYYEANWGGSQYRIVYYCKSSSDDLIYSFPISHDIFKVNLQNWGQVNQKYFGSLYFDKIPAFSNYKLVPPSDEENRKYFFTNPSYKSIDYDEYNNVYYRVAELPISEENHASDNIQKKFIKQFTVIIGDNSFSILGEHKFEWLDVSFDNRFINKQGLHLMNINDNEDSLSFSIYQPTKIK